jgi:hypothetical protein
MKKRILIGIFLSIFTLLMLPSVQAVEYNTALETIKKEICISINSLKNIDEKLKTKVITKLEKIEDIDDETFKLLKKANGLLHKTRASDDDDVYLKMALLCFLCGCYFKLMGYESYAKFYFRLAIFYLILYVLYSM